MLPRFALWLALLCGCEGPTPRVPQTASDAGEDLVRVQESDVGPIVIAHPPKRAHGPFDDIRPIDLPETLGRHDLSEHLKSVPDWFLGTNAIPPTYLEPSDVTAETGEIGVLVCHVDRHGPSMDTHGSEEPMVRWSVGKYRAVTQRNDASFWFSLPGVVLKKGQKVAVTVWDQDVTENELIGRVSHTYDGARAFQVAAKAFDLRCRWHTDIDAVAQERHAAAEEAMHAWVDALNAIESSWIFPVTEEAAFVDALAALVAVVGWADERVQRLVGWRDALVDRWTLLSTAHFEELGLTAGEWHRNASGTFEARLVKFRCRPRAWKIYDRLWRAEHDACGGEVEVRNLTKVPIEIDPFFKRGFPEGDFQVHHRRGRPMALRSHTFRFPEGAVPTQVPEGQRRATLHRGDAIGPGKSAVYRLEAVPWLLAPEWKNHPADFHALQIGRGDEAIFVPLR